MIEGAHCSIVGGRSDAQQTWMTVKTSEYFNDGFLLVNSPHMRLYSSMLAKGSDT